MDKNFLSRADQRKVEDLALAHKVDIEAGKWTYQAFSELATRKLGMPISKGNVIGACKAMSITTPRGSHRTRTVDTTIVRLLAKILLKCVAEFKPDTVTADERKALEVLATPPSDES